LHHAGYREKFADNLKRELPRIPLAPDFKAFSKVRSKNNFGFCSQPAPDRGSGVIEFG
jgi:hypothetical protein